MQLSLALQARAHVIAWKFSTTLIHQSILQKVSFSLCQTVFTSSREEERKRREWAMQANGRTNCYSYTYSRRLVYLSSLVRVLYILFYLVFTQSRVFYGGFFFSLCLNKQLPHMRNMSARSFAVSSSKTFLMLASFSRYHDTVEVTQQPSSFASD